MYHSGIGFWREENDQPHQKAMLLSKGHLTVVSRQIKRNIVYLPCNIHTKCLLCIFWSAEFSLVVFLKKSANALHKRQASLLSKELMQHDNHWRVSSDELNEGTGCQILSGFLTYAPPQLELIASFPSLWFKVWDLTLGVNVNAVSGLHIHTVCPWNNLWNFATPIHMYRKPSGLSAGCKWLVSKSFTQ